jgi:hypothetical protein
MSTQWFYQRDGQEMLGPCSAKELKHLASTGQLLESDRVRKEGMEKPVRAGRVKGLFITPSGQGEGGTP